MGKKLISVIVPIYNVELYLEECIESLLNQTYKDIEIILVDDGSPDRCPDICDYYQSKDDRIRVIHKENGGLVSARKAGIRKSTGYYIGYVDGDDWAEPDFYKTLYEAANNCNADIVAAAHKRDLLDSVSIIKNNIPSGIYSGTLLNEIFRSMLFNGSFFQHGISSYVWSKLFKQKILFENQMHVADDVFIGEDSACVYPSLLKTERLCIIDDAQYHYRQRADSMLKTVGKPETEINNLDILYQNMKESFRDSKYKVIMMPQLKYFILNLLIIRSGGIWTENGGKTYSHIFSDMRKDSRVIIYSAGTFGQLLVKKISSTGYAKIIAWIDPDYRQYCECGLDIKPLEAVNGSQYDYLIIASTDADVVRQAQKHFIGLGVPEFKIATIDCKLGKAEKLLKASGFYNI